MPHESNGGVLNHVHETVLQQFCNFFVQDTLGVG